MGHQDQVSSSDNLIQKGDEAEGHGAAEDNCCLRLHVPHFVGATTRDSSSSGASPAQRPSEFQLSFQQSPSLSQAAASAVLSGQQTQDPSTLTSAGGPQSGSLARLHGSNSSSSIGRLSTSQSGHRQSR